MIADQDTDNLMRIQKGPSRPKRVAHAVLGTPKVKETVNWFRHHLGFICSDDVYAGDKSNLIGSFNRRDRGELRRVAVEIGVLCHAEQRAEPAERFVGDWACDDGGDEAVEHGEAVGDGLQFA